MHKNIKLQYPFKLEARSSTVNTNQIKSIILQQNTRSVQEMESLPMRNASYLKFCTFSFKNNKNTTLKSTKKHRKNNKKHKNITFF